MNKRISQFLVAETLTEGDAIPIVNDLVTKKVLLSSITDIPISFTKNNFLPVSGGIIANNLQINGELIVKNNTIFEKNLTTVTLISTRDHKTSAHWNDTNTIVRANSAAWSTGGTFVQNNSAKWNDVYTTVYTNSSKWESAYDILEANAYDWSNALKGTGIVGYIPKFLDTNEIGNSVIYESIAGNVGISIANPIDDAKLTVNGKIKGLKDLEILGFSTLSSAWFKGGVRIDGALSALGGTVNINTTVSETSSLNIYNTGVGPALRVTQIGAFDVANFSDEYGTILCVTDKSNVGIGSCNTDPTVKLDVFGPIKASNTVIRDWFNPGNTDINNIKPGTTSSSTFGTIIEGYPNGHFVLGLRSNDQQDGFCVISKSAFGLTYDKNCFTVLNNGNVGIGERNPSRNLHVVGSYLQTINANGDYIVNIQDGSGRVNHYWNTTGTTTPTFRKGGESATRWLMGGQDQDPFEVYISQDGISAAAGDLITWIKLFTINRATQYVGIGVDVPLRHLHVVNRVAGSTELILEQSEAKSNYKKWNFVVDGGSSTSGSGVGSRFYIRQLNDLGTGGNIPFFIASDGNIGINNEFLPAVALDVSGNIKLGQRITMGKNMSTEDVHIEIGSHRTGSGNSYLDLHSTSGVDFSSRFWREAGVNGMLHLINKGTGVLNITQENSSSIYFKTQNNVRVEIDSQGRVGIGTDVTKTIAEKLEVKGNILVGDSNTLNYIRFTGVSGDGGDGGDSNHTVIAERLYSGVDKSELLLAKGNDPGTGTVGPDRIRLLSGSIAFDTITSIPWGPNGEGISLSDLIESGDTKMYIHNNGNVGIGDAFPTNNPITQLHINKSGYGSIMLGNNATTGFHITKETTDNSFNIWTGVFSTSTNRLKITNAGLVGIGTGANNPQTRLHVNSTQNYLANVPAAGATPANINMLGNYPPLGEVNAFSAIFQGPGSDTGGILIITGDNNDDEKAIDVWSEDANKTIFRVKAKSGNTMIGGSTTMNGDLDLTNNDLKRYKVIVHNKTVTVHTDEYTLQDSDTGSVIYVRPGAASNYIIYVPATLPIGFNVMIVNGSTRSVSIQPVAGSGVSILNAYNKISVGVQNGICNFIMIDTNKALISGDLS